MPDPDPPMPPVEPRAPDPSADLVAYLERYGDRYTREAMAARLIEGGHDPDAVERALAAVHVETPAAVAVVVGLPVAFLGGCIAWANTGGSLFG